MPSITSHRRGAQRSAAVARRPRGRKWRAGHGTARHGMASANGRACRVRVRACGGRAARGLRLRWADSGSGSGGVDERTERYGTLLALAFEVTGPAADVGVVAAAMSLSSGLSTPVTLDYTRRLVVRFGSDRFGAESRRADGTSQLFFIRQARRQ